MLNSYDFDNGLTDTLGVGNALVASGGTLTNGRYDFGLNQGLQLTDALADTSNYGIEMRFRMNDSTLSYNKLIDFDELGSDQGLYVFNGALRYFTAALNNSGAVE